MRYAGRVRRVNRRVLTMRGPQNHHGYVGYVQLTTSTKQDCGHHLHQKYAVAQRCADKLARKITKERS